MTREEKIKKITELNKNANYDWSWDDLSEKILDVLEEKPAPTFRQNEIIKVSGYEHYLRYSQLVDKNDARKLSPAELAATCAPPDAKWWAVDKNNLLYFFTEEPEISFTVWAGEPAEIDSVIINAYCPVDDWTTEKGKL